MRGKSKRYDARSVRQAHRDNDLKYVCRLANRSLKDKTHRSAGCRNGTEKATAKRRRRERRMRRVTDLGLERRRERGEMDCGEGRIAKSSTAIGPRHLEIS